MRERAREFRIKEIQSEDIRIDPKEEGLPEHKVMFSQGLLLGELTNSPFLPFFLSVMNKNNNNRLEKTITAKSKPFGSSTQPPR